jgi:hypothetical protein
MEPLEVFANLASIVTPVLGGLAYLRFQRERDKKQERLESYLKNEKQENPDRRTHTILHLMAHVGLTEDEILRASFKSKHIRRTLHVDFNTGLADEILFDYQDLE